MKRLHYLFAAVIWLPLIVASVPAPQLAPTEPIVLPIPPGVFLGSTNPQMYRDRMGVIFAATRTDSAVGGVVWRVDGYIDAEHPGIATYVINDPKNPQPEKFFANGELSVWADGYLWYTTVEIESLANRTGLRQVSHPVPGWTP